MTPENEGPEQRASGCGPPNDCEEFDEAAYLEVNLDVAQEVASGTYASGREHWDRYGRSEGRLATRPKDFDELRYLDLNPDVLQAVLSGECPSGYYHWICHGKAEGRAIHPPAVLPPGWNEARYLRLNPDVAYEIHNGVFASGYEHWIRLGYFEGRPGTTEPPAKTLIQDALRAVPPGVNLFAFHETVIGLGAAARGYAAAFQRLLAVHKVDIPWDLSALQEIPPAPSPYAINVVHMNPDALPSFLRRYGPQVLPSRYTLGYWVWELHAGYAPWRAMSRIFNGVWTPSAYSASALRTVSAAPVHVVPHVIDCLPAPDVIPRAELGLAAGAFLFLYVFDVASTFDRKNPLALVRAFRKAFGERRDVQLLLKYHHAGSDPPAIRLLERLAHSTPNIRTLNRILPEDQICGLLHSCDCFVSPHRSEGFGLNIATAMYFGKPVIVTGYSGNTDFTTPENSFPIDYDLVAVQRDTGAYKANYVWAEPSEDHLAHLLRTVIASPEEAHRRAELGRGTVRRQYSITAVSATIRDALISAGLNLPPSPP
jgi:glycosyltransferase involved in cell wall biosynthesis